MLGKRALTLGLALALALGTAALPLAAAEGIALVPPGLQPPSGVVKGPVGAIVNGNFNGPALDAQNSIEAKLHYDLESAQTGQVYVQIFDQALQPRGILGVQNVNKGAGNVTLRFSLACTPGAPASTPVHSIVFGITRFGPPPPTVAALPPISKTHPVRYEFECPVRTPIAIPTLTLRTPVAQPTLTLRTPIPLPTKTN